MKSGYGNIRLNYTTHDRATVILVLKYRRTLVWTVTWSRNLHDYPIGPSVSARQFLLILSLWK